MTFTHYCHSEGALATEESLRFFASLRMTKRENAQNDMCIQCCHSEGALATEESLRFFATLRMTSVYITVILRERSDRRIFEILRIAQNDKKGKCSE